MYRFLFIIFFFVILLGNNLLNASVKIKYKVGDEIITNTDINNEKNYLFFLRPDLKNLTNSEMLKISEKSIIRDLIKKRSEQGF